MKRDDAAFAGIVREHGALVTRIAYSHERDPNRAQELVQEILLSIWQALPRFRGEASLRTFVARIAHNRAVSHIAHEARTPAGVPIDDFAEALQSEAPTPEDVLTRADARKRLERAVQSLPMALRVTVTLALEGFSNNEVADVLGVSVSAAGVRLHRARAALQDKLKDDRS